MNQTERKLRQLRRFTSERHPEVDKSKVQIGDVFIAKEKETGRPFEARILEIFHKEGRLRVQRPDNTKGCIIFRKRNLDKITE